MAMPLYNVGTATLTNGSTAMVGQGTLWLGNVRPGDQVVSYTGQTAIVGTVNSNTSITLARAFRGTSQTAQAYEILYTPDDPFTQQLAREVLQGISASALVKLGGVTPAARKLVRFDAAANAALSDLSDFALTLLDDANGPAMYGTLGQIPNAQVRNDLTPDKAFRRGNILGTVSQSGGVPTGALIERGANANGEYVRLADGTQICWKTLNVGSSPFGPIGSISFSVGADGGTYAASFAGVPSVSVGVDSSTGLVWPTLGSSPTLTNYPYCYMLSPTSGVVTNISLLLIAIGRWI